MGRFHLCAIYLATLFPDNHGSGDRPGCEVSGAGQFSESVRRLKTAGTSTQVMLGRLWEKVRGEEGQNVSEYAVILVLLVLIVVATVHAIGMNAQQVIDRVNTALHG